MAHCVGQPLLLSGGYHLFLYVGKLSSPIALMWADHPLLPGGQIVVTYCFVCEQVVITHIIVCGQVVITLSVGKCSMAVWAGGHHLLHCLWASPIPFFRMSSPVALYGGRWSSPLALSVGR